MSPEQWQQSTDPSAMLSSLEGELSRRKIGLFAVACCERIQDYLIDARSRSAIATLRRAADGKAEEEELYRELADAGEATWGARREVIVPLLGEGGWHRARRIIPRYPDTLEPEVVEMVEKNGDVLAARAVEEALTCFISRYYAPLPITHFASLAAQSAAQAVATKRFDPEQDHIEKQWQAQVLRDVLPFSTPALDPDALWLTPLVKTSAGTIYQQRRFEDLPIFADALEDAGCDQTQILSHCRSELPHTRGCWVIDQILDRD